MSVSVQVVMVGDKALVATLKDMPKEVVAALTRKVTVLALRLEAHVKRDKLQGQVLNHRTGRLQRSIHHVVTSNKNEIKARVGSSSDVPYAAIHEFGGTTRPHVIEPKRARMLAFMSSGKMVFARKVNHPGSKMPERSFLRSSLFDHQNAIKIGMQEAIAEGMAAAAAGNKGKK